MGFLWYIIIGIAAGFLAGKIMRGGGFGVIINLILGIAGGVLGGWVFGLLGIAASGTTPYVIGAMQRKKPLKKRRGRRRKAELNGEEGDMPLIAADNDVADESDSDAEE